MEKGLAKDSLGCYIDYTKPITAITTKGNDEMLINKNTKPTLALANRIMDGTQLGKGFTQHTYEKDGLFITDGFFNGKRITRRAYLTLKMLWLDVAFINHCVIAKELEIRANGKRTLHYICAKHPASVRDSRCIEHDKRLYKMLISKPLQAITDYCDMRLAA